MTGDVLTVTIGRTVGADLVATVTLPLVAWRSDTADPVDVGTTAVGVSAACIAHEDHGHGVPARWPRTCPTFSMCRWIKQRLRR